VGFRSTTTALALLILACQVPPKTHVPPESGDACANLAYVFFLIADARDRGDTKEDQIEKLQASVENPFATRRETTLRSLLGVVDLVYLRPDESAEEIRESVLADCAVDERGRAVVARPKR
jgi:hypothetical protein